MGRAKLLLFVLVVVAVSGQLAAEASAPLKLEPSSESRRLEVGETHLYTLRAEADQYLWLMAFQKGADVRLTIKGPEAGEGTVNDRHFGSGPEVLYWITESEGKHTISVENVGDVPGAYKLEWKESEPSTAVLRRRIGADRDYVKALGLQEQVGRDSWRQALELYKPTLQVWKDIDDDVLAASTLNNMGYCQRLLEDYEAAASWYEQAIERWPEPDYSTHKAKSLSNLAAVRLELEQPYLAVGDYQRAVEILRGALEILRESEAPDRQIRSLEIRIARARSALATAYKAQGRLEDAEKELLVALADLEGSEEPTFRQVHVLALNSLGVVYTQLGEVEKGFENLEQAEDLLDELPEGHMRLRAQAAIATNQGAIFDWVGEPMAALEKYLAALELKEQATDQAGEAYVRRHLGLLYRGLGEYDRALEHLEKSAGLRQGLGKVVGTAEIRVVVGDVLRRAGRTAEALEILREAIRVLETRNVAVQLAAALEKLGLALEATGDFDEARGAYRRALGLLDGFEEPGRKGRLLAAAGANELAKARSGAELKRAEMAFDRALELSYETRDHSTKVDALIGLAQVERQREDFGSAQRFIGQALEVVESVRGRVGGQRFRASYFSQQLRAFELAVNILYARHLREPHAGFDRRAFEVSERMRARVLHDLTVTSRAELLEGVAPKLVAEELWLRRRIAAQEKFLATSGRFLNPETLRSLEKQLSNALSEHQQLEGRLHSLSPVFSELSQLPLSLRRVQQELLDDETALLEILLGDEQSLLWVVTTSGYRLELLPSREILEGQARQLRDQLMVPAQRPSQATLAERQSRPRDLEASEREFVNLGTEFSSRLLNPIEDLLGNRRLVIVADGALRLLPFAALPAPGSTVAKWEPLIAEREVVQAPSASVLAALRSRDRPDVDRLLAIFADPVFQRTDTRFSKRPLAPPDPLAERFAAIAALRGDTRTQQLQRLYHSDAEAREILSLAKEHGPVFEAIGFNATREKVLEEDLARYFYLHFATHGLVDDRQPGLSGIALSMFDAGGEAKDGLLRLHDIYGLQLGAELVVLSACETAVGREIRGEGLMSLSRGFMYAGAPRVLASLWRVDDLLTADFMKRFYRGLLADGLSPAAALRRSVLESRAEATEGGRQHPYYWAGFGLFGDWR